MRSRRALLGLASLAVLVGTGVVATLRPRWAPDVSVSVAVQSVETRPLTILARAISFPGDGFAVPAALVLAVAIFGAACGKTRAAATLALLCLFAFGLEQSLKAAVPRSRPGSPVRQLTPAPATHSFPSGHVVWFVTLSGGAFGLRLVRLHDARLRGAVALLAAYGVLLAASRVYLGHHYATDVLGGAALATLLAILAARRT